MFGTIHSLGIDAARAKHAEAMERFDTAEVLVVETDFWNIDAEDLARRNTSDLELDTLLTAEEWKTLRLGTSHLLSENALRYSTPAYALQLFTNASVNRGRRRTEAMDVALVLEAQARGIEIRYLEPVGVQLALVGQSSLDDLKATLAYGATRLSDDVTALENDWLEGNVQALEARLNQTSDEQQRILFDQRNSAWTTALSSFFKSESRQIFVAVGAGHLLRGENGLPAMLRRNGVAVTRQPGD